MLNGKAGDAFASEAVGVDPECISDARAPLVVCERVHVWEEGTRESSVGQDGEDDVYG